MNEIPKNQNTQKQLERLAAQRELYSSAKKWHMAQIITTVLLPVVLATISIYHNELAIASAIFGVSAFVFDISIMEIEIERKKKKAAKIQELFDCDVLKIPKSPLKTVDDITVEEVLSHYKAHIKIETNVEKIRDWYSPLVGKLSLKTARILCQRTNCWWDSKLRQRYSSFLRYTAIIVFGIIMLLGYFANLTLIEFTLIVSALVPFFQFSIKQAKDNREAALRLNDLVSYSIQIWNEALKNSCDEKTMIINSRRLQDEIFEHRSKSPLILDIYYRLFRDEDEDLMNRTSEILVEEAIENNCR